ncbi:MAG: hypothetical protein FWH56_08595 [Betaproteobacteria bacterium]|nr:hypothetical protein [Betaproteobacteria bacterium]
MFKYLFVLAGAITVSGCASMLGDPVSEPKDGERARLRAVLGTSWVDQNVCGDRPDLSEGVFVYLNTPYEKRSLGMPRGTLGSMPSRAWGEMYVRADQQIKVKINWASGKRNCALEFYFKPEKDRDYEFVTKGASFSGQFRYGPFRSCALGLSAYDITDGNNTPLELSREKLPCN